MSCSGPGRISTRALSYAVVACAKANQLDEAFNIIELYRDDSTEREVITNYALNSLIAACGRVQRPDVAVQLINESQKKFRVAPDVKSYRIAIIACNQAEHREAKIARTSDAPANLDFTWWQCALSLLRRMIEDGLTPDCQTYSSVVSALESGETCFFLSKVIFTCTYLLQLDNGNEQLEFCNLCLQYHPFLATAYLLRS